jgi:two-component system alkaline phosphatase synthesis response regulator PhoP
MSTHILLVEDEENLRKTIQLNLELEEYRVTTANTGKEGLDSFERGRYDLVILDVMLPEMDGFDVCKAIRSRNKQVPVLFLTAKGSSEDKVKGLRMGADDYITKPFNLEEFLLRVVSLLRRGKQPEKKKTIEKYQFGDNWVHFGTFEIQNSRGETTTLSKREVRLLQLLIERVNEVVSREEILEAVWGRDVYPSSRTIDNYILAFRKYFESNPKEPRHFHAIRGVGYKFTDSE